MDQEPAIIPLVLQLLHIYKIDKDAEEDPMPLPTLHLYGKMLYCKTLFFTTRPHDITTQALSTLAFLPCDLLIHSCFTQLTY